MVIPFSNTKLRVPTGFQSLLVGLSTEVLRSQPRNLHAFAADYFEKLLKRRDEGHSTGSDTQTSLEDRYYNNKSFQEEYPVNDPEVNHAATKIQANFRGHRARREVEGLKRDNKQIIDTDEQELGYPTEKRDATPTKEETIDLNQFQEEELTAEEKDEQERAARAIQARFRGHRDRKSATPPQTARSNNQETDTERAETQLSSDEADRPRLEREPTQLSEDFERHTQVPRDSDFDREINENQDDDDDDDPNLTKAATKIQASFRGYKTRKEIASTQVQPAATVEEPEPEPEDEDDEETAAAAVKIQAAYRGYRTRKDLDQ